MEADSTTVEQDFDLINSYDGDRENDFVQEISRNYPHFQNIVLPLLKKGREMDMLDWMRGLNLIQTSLKCSKNLPDCNMLLSQSKVVDKYQWQCHNCNQKTPIRENSFFKNIYCSLQIVIKILVAWCEDEDYDHVANVFGLKKQIVNGIYDKIEKAVCGRPLPRLGGTNSVVFIELYPNFADELYPVSSKNDSSPKTQHKILCLADTNVHTRYWLHLITGVSHIQNENNNTIAKKMSLCDEVLHLIEKVVSPGSYCVIGEGAQLALVRETLLSSNLISGIISMSHFRTQSSGEMQSFLLNNMWKSIIKLCEAAQDLPRNKIQSYLSCALWRWQVHPPENFTSLIDLIARQDYKTLVNGRK